MNRIPTNASIRGCDYKTETQGKRRSGMLGCCCCTLTKKNIVDYISHKLQLF